MRKKELVIKIGGDMDADDRKLFQSSAFAKSHPRNILYLDSFEQLHKLLTPSRFDLLRFLVEGNGKESVSEIAEQTNRKQEAISRDLGALSQLQLIEKKRSQKTIQPKARYYRLVIEFQAPKKR